MWSMSLLLYFKVPYNDNKIQSMILNLILDVMLMLEHSPCMQEVGTIQIPAATDQS